MLSVAQNPITDASTPQRNASLTTLTSVPATVAALIVQSGQVLHTIITILYIFFVHSALGGGERIWKFKRWVYVC